VALLAFSNKKNGISYIRDIMMNENVYIKRRKMAFPWNQGQGSFKVIENGTIR